MIGRMSFIPSTTIYCPLGSPSTLGDKVTKLRQFVNLVPNDDTLASDANLASIAEMMLKKMTINLANVELKHFHYRKGSFIEEEEGVKHLKPSDSNLAFLY